jgi:Glycosyltransferase family 87
LYRVNKATLHKVALVSLACMAMVSLVVASEQAVHASRDFQWTGARLLAQHIDPWATTLKAKPLVLVDLSPPNYLHELYVLLLPLTGLSFRTASLVWCVGNILLSLVIVVCIRRLYAFDGRTTLVLLLLLWMSLPFRSALAKGQQSLLELALLCLFYTLHSAVSRGVLLGLSYAKYSFSPVLFMVLLFRGRFRVLTISLLPPVLGFLVVWYMLGGAPLRLAVEPLLVSRLNVSPGLGDLMTLIDRLLQRHLAQPPITPLSYAIALVCSIAYGFRLAWRQLAPDAELTLLSLATLLIFKHLVYDYVFLILPLALVLKRSSRAGKGLTFVTVFMFWYGWRLVGLAARPMQPLPIHIVNVLLLGLTLLALDISATLGGASGHLVVNPALRGRFQVDTSVVRKVGADPLGDARMILSSVR